MTDVNVAFHLVKIVKYKLELLLHYFAMNDNSAYIKKLF